MDAKDSSAPKDAKGKDATDGKESKDPKKDMLAELDLAALFEKRAEAAKKQKEAADRLVNAKAVHLCLLVVGGGVMAIVATSLWPALRENDPERIFWLSASIILCAAMWIAAFFPAVAVRALQDHANATSKKLKDIDGKIEFCHQVLEEAKRVKVRKYAEAWVEKQKEKQTS